MFFLETTWLFWRGLLCLRRALEADAEESWDKMGSVLFLRLKLEKGSWWEEGMSPFGGMVSEFLLFSWLRWETPRKEVEGTWAFVSFRPKPKLNPLAGFFSVSFWLSFDWSNSWETDRLGLPSIFQKRQLSKPPFYFLLIWKLLSSFSPTLWPNPKHMKEWILNLLSKFSGLSMIWEWEITQSNPGLRSSMQVWLIQCLFSFKKRLASSG